MPQIINSSFMGLTIVFRVLLAIYFLLAINILYAILNFISTGLFSLIYLLVVIICHKQNPYPLVSVAIFTSKINIVKVSTKNT